ncbi:Transcriptional-regulating factor 1 [Pontoporia blainvillei]|uniref:Transcriptional-regulating factor 1 n=1 Tax=Pontoporia blainvillei TaxID=48723 RepID=A0ABX0RY43_PONBL|nr:Transcriptional-regulating factor 1 [Pontoporia blainvillei]
MMWGSPAQAEPTDGYQYTYSQASEIRTQKLTSGVLHKLDSFTQVFANQNLRIQVNNMAQVLHTQSAVMDGAPESALRQLLSQKPMEPPAPALPSRYQQVPQQPHPGFTGGLSKPALQLPQYYQSSSMMQHLPESRQPQMHLQPPSYHRDPHQYTPEQAHAVQLVQLGSVPQYYYQEPQQPYGHPMYQQSHLPQHQQPEDGLPKTYPSDRQAQAMLTSHGDLGPLDTGMGDPASSDLNRVSSALPHRPLLSPSGIHLNNMGPQHQQPSPSAVWPQLLPPKPSSQGFANSIAAAPSARDKPASSMSDDEMPVLVRMTLSPPHSPQGAAPHPPAEIPKKHQPGLAKAEEALKTAPEKKKFRHRPEPLFIPPPPSYTPNLAASHSGATLYQSQLRSPRVLGDHLLLDPAHELPPYTPPPMLSPVRQGSGLFSNVLISGHGAGAHPQLPLTPLTPTPRVLLCRPNSIDGSNVTVTPGPGEQTVDVEPRINIGLRFQAEIPELQDVSALAQDTHKATLVWKPWPELENHDFQQRVENLLNLCCSSALPGGGTNSEFALHSLFEAKGDVMAALEMLLLRKPVRLKCHPLANYHYADSTHSVLSAARALKASGA